MSDVTDVLDWLVERGHVTPEDLRGAEVFACRVADPAETGGES